ncbi:hypothetical protein MIND_00199000 [Mycena indigotica]|uniref:F-box domain-containing protein n=1 Tax=Mycena indigotica TaxID=2126181 RepID=A0A8H6WCX2_9AGAR|nr:uncharacterized protein MIND_00199000 [Mycena indigotica]KAF7311881.1 hypothetical protein MIND_00199000 [Mycena indigotica]
MLQVSVGVGSAPPQTLHRCLQIPEIILQVFAEVALQHSPNTTLAALARTCRVFEQPALELLWADPGPYTLHYILNCFPPGLFAYSADQPCHWQPLTLTVPPSDWARPRRYCNLEGGGGGPGGVGKKLSDPISVIRTLNPPWASYHEPHCAELSILGGTSPDAVLFPRLRKLVISVPGSDNPDRWLRSLFQSLLSPTLRFVTVEETFDPEVYPDIDVTPLIQMIVSHTPQLTTLVLITSDSLHVASDLFRNLCHLQVLTMSYMADNMLPHVAQLKSLKELTIGELDLAARPSKTLQALDNQCTFPSLEILAIENVDVLRLTQIMHLFRLSPLHTLWISPLLHTDLTTADMTAFYRSVDAYVNKQTLQQFQYELRSSSLSHVDISADALRSLQGFSGLTRLYIECSGKYLVRDSDIEALACAWPALETFVLHPTEPAQRTRLTLSFLVALATHCPCLAAIDVSFDATVVPTTIAIDDSGKTLIKTPLAVLSLNTGFTPIKNPIEVAHFLAHLFPHLSIALESDWDPTDRSIESEAGLTEASNIYAARWNEVSAIIQKLAAEGKEEGK